MSKRHYYALGDSFVGFIGTEFSWGFANTKVKLVFDSAAARNFYLKSTKLLGAKPLKVRERTDLKVIYVRFVEPVYSPKWEFELCHEENKNFGEPTSKENMERYIQMCKGELK